MKHQDLAWKLLAEKLEYALYVLAQQPEAFDDLPNRYSKLQAIAQICMGEITTRRKKGLIGPVDGPVPFVEDMAREGGA